MLLAKIELLGQELNLYCCLKEQKVKTVHVVQRELCTDICTQSCSGKISNMWKRLKGNVHFKTETHISNVHWRGKKNHCLLSFAVPVKWFPLNILMMSFTQTWYHIKLIYCMVKVYGRMYWQAGKLKYALLSFLLKLVCHAFTYICNYRFVMK